MSESGISFVEAGESKVTILEAAKNRDGDFELKLNLPLLFSDSSVFKFPWTVWGTTKKGGENLVGSEKANAFVGKVSAGLEPYPADVGIKDFGRSYNLLEVSDGKRRFFVGAIQTDPESIAIMGYRPGGNGEVEVAVTGLNRGGETKASSMRVMFIEGMDREKAIDTYLSYSHKPTRNVINNQSFFCTWAPIGMGVNELSTSVQARYAKELGIKFFVVDDGYQTNLEVGRDFDRNKFRDPKAVFSSISELGMVPGLWEAPFHTMAKDQFTAHPEWFIEGAIDPLLVRPASMHGIPVRRAAYIYDISIAEVRDHIIGNLVEKQRLGVGIFKLDFLYAPLLYNLRNKEQTPTSYFHTFMRELRQALPTGVYLMGCGVPVADCFEFDANRTSGDSASPRMSGYLFSEKVSKMPWVKNKVIAENTRRYEDSVEAAMVISKLIANYGPVLDGIHFGIKRGGHPIPAEVRDSVNERFSEFFGKSGVNVTFGDNLARLYRGEARAFADVIASE